MADNDDENNRASSPLSVATTLDLSSSGAMPQPYQRIRISGSNHVLAEMLSPALYGLRAWSTHTLVHDLFATIVLDFVYYCEVDLCFTSINFSVHTGVVLELSHLHVLSNTHVFYTHSTLVRYRSTNGDTVTAWNTIVDLATQMPTPEHSATI
jgi:hypothetical protein